MRLRTFVPKLPESLLNALEDCGIRTDTDILFSGTPLQIYEQLPQGIISLAELESCIWSITNFVAVPGTRADEVLAQEVARRGAATCAELVCGVPELDKLLNGNFGPNVLEISGDHGTGKTLLALQILTRQLCAEAKFAALWVDTTGDFSADKLFPMQSAFQDAPAAGTASERLQVALAFDVNAAQEILETTFSDYQMSDESLKFRFVVIDSITTLFRPLLSVVSSQGHAMMASFMRYLRTLALTHSLSIFVINSTSSAGPANIGMASGPLARKPALGPSFAYMTDATLWLSRSGTGSTGGDRSSGVELGPLYEAQVLRSKITVSGTLQSFRIRDGLLCSSTN